MADESEDCVFPHCMANVSQYVFCKFRKFGFEPAQLMSFEIKQTQVLGTWQCLEFKLKNS